MCGQVSRAERVCSQYLRSLRTEQLPAHSVGLYQGAARDLASVGKYQELRNYSHMCWRSSRVGHDSACADLYWTGS